VDCLWVVEELILVFEVALNGLPKSGLSLNTHPEIEPRKVNTGSIMSPWNCQERHERRLVSTGIIYKISNFSDERII
jgi:hypothetical protein